MELKESGIVYLHTHEDSSIGIEEVEEIYAVLTSVTDGKPCFLMVFPGKGTSASKEAREYAANVKKGKKIVAEAIITNSLPIRILANFFMRVNRPRQKVKLFSQEKDALEWIQGIMAEFESANGK